MSASPSLAPPAPMSHHSPSPRPTSASTPKFTPNHPRPLVHPHLDSRSHSASPRQAQDEDRNHDPRHSLHSSFSSNESPWQSSRVSVRALTEMAEPSTPVSMSAAAAAAGLVALNGAKSRKSSCDLCHHRKIKVSALSERAGTWKLLRPFGVLRHSSFLLHLTWPSHTDIPCTSVRPDPTRLLVLSPQRTNLSFLRRDRAEQSR